MGSKVKSSRQVVLYIKSMLLFISISIFLTGCYEEEFHTVVKDNFGHGFTVTAFRDLNGEVQVVTKPTMEQLYDRLSSKPYVYDITDNGTEKTMMLRGVPKFNYRIIDHNRISYHFEIPVYTGTTQYPYLGTGNIVSEFYIVEIDQANVYAEAVAGNEGAGKTAIIVNFKKTKNNNLVYVNTKTESVVKPELGQLVLGYFPLPDNGIIPANNGDNILVMELNPYGLVNNYGITKAKVYVPSLTVKAEYMPKQIDAADRAHSYVTVAEPVSKGNKLVYTIFAPGNWIETPAFANAKLGYTSFSSDGLVPLGASMIAIAEVDANDKVQRFGTAVTHKKVAGQLTVTATDPRGEGNNDHTIITIAEKIEQGNSLVYSNYRNHPLPIIYKNQVGFYIVLPNNGLIPAKHGDLIVVEEIDPHGRVIRVGHTNAVVVDSEDETQLASGLTVSSFSAFDFHTRIVVDEVAGRGNRFVYKNYNKSQVEIPYVGDLLSDYVDLIPLIKASHDDRIAVAEVDATGKVVRFGQTTARVTMTSFNLPPIIPPIITPIILMPISDQMNDEGEYVELTVTATVGSTRSPVYSASGLPNGLSINSGNGTISGTLAYNNASATVTSAVYNVTVNVSTPTEISSQSFDWVIHNVDTTPTLTVIGHSPDPITGDVNIMSGLLDFLEIELRANDQDGDRVDYIRFGHSHSSDHNQFFEDLPPGLQFDPVTQKITGRPMSSVSAGTHYVILIVIKDNTPHPTAEYLDIATLMIVWTIVDD